MPIIRQPGKNPTPEKGCEERELVSAEWVKLRSSCKLGTKTLVAIAAFQRLKGTLRPEDLTPEEREAGTIWGFQNILNVHFHHTKLPYKVVMRNDGRESEKSAGDWQRKPINPRIVLLTKKEAKTNVA